MPYIKSEYEEGTFNRLNRFTSPQGALNELSSQSDKFIYSAEKAGISYDVAKRLFKLWKNQSLNEDWQYTQNIYNTENYLNKTGSVFGLPLTDRYVVLNDVLGNSITLELVFINASRAKKVSKKTIPGMDYTVKELISKGDIEITLKGSLFSNHPYKYPRLETARLHEILSTDSLLEIESNQINNFLKVTEVSVDRFQIKDDERFSNMVNFNIKMTSDRPINIIKSE